MVSKLFVIEQNLVGSGCRGGKERESRCIQEIQFVLYISMSNHFPQVPGLKGRGKKVILQFKSCDNIVIDLWLVHSFGI